jgi:hypothetical protein
MTKPAFAAILILAATTASALAEDLKPNGTFAGTAREQGQSSEVEAPQPVAERPVINEFGDRKANGAYQEASAEADGTDSVAPDDGAKARATNGRVVGISGADLRRAIERAPRTAAPPARADASPGAGIDPAEVRRKIRDRTTSGSERDGI